MNNPSLPPSVNFHLWQPCNMNCRFCFATFTDVRADLPKGHLPQEQAMNLVRVLARTFDKITFAGGEPTLCPWLPELIRAAKAEGATTMVVTNGTGLLELLDKCGESIGWVALSIDSANPDTLLATGRAIRGRVPLTREQTIELTDRCRAHGVRVKVNTVVTSANVAEDMSELIKELQPERWKAFQVLPVEGQNDGRVEDLLITQDQFVSFLERHKHTTPSPIGEANDDMRGSYAMIDPAGRFFDNTTGRHTYSAPILKVGIEAAWEQITFRPEVFDRRGGHYDWRSK